MKIACKQTQRTFMHAYVYKYSPNLLSHRRHIIVLISHVQTASFKYAVYHCVPTRSNGIIYNSKPSVYFLKQRQMEEEIVVGDL